MKKPSLFIAFLPMVLSVSASLPIAPSRAPGSVPPARPSESVQSRITKGTCSGNRLDCHAICSFCGNKIYYPIPVDDDTFEILNGTSSDYIVEYRVCGSVLSDIK